MQFAYRSETFDQGAFFLQSATRTLLATLRNPAGGRQATTTSPPEMKAMTDNRADLDPSSWDPALDAVIAAPKHHKVLFENERLRVLEVTLEANDEEPIHHHRWP